MSVGRKILQDPITKEILWEGAANLSPPTKLYPGAQIINVHEPVTIGKQYIVGEKFDG